MHTVPLDIGLQPRVYAPAPSVDGVGGWPRGQVRCSTTTDGYVILRVSGSVVVWQGSDEANSAYLYRYPLDNFGPSPKDDVREVVSTVLDSPQLSYSESANLHMLLSEAKRMSAACGRARGAWVSVPTHKAVTWGDVPAVGDPDRRSDIMHSGYLSEECGLIRPFGGRVTNVHTLAKCAAWLRDRRSATVEKALPVHLDGLPWLAVAGADGAGFAVPFYPYVL